MDDIDIILKRPAGDRLSRRVRGLQGRRAHQRLPAPVHHRRRGAGHAPRSAPPVPRCCASSACASPSSSPNIAPVITPVELAAILARREAVEKTGLKPEEIGVFSIVTCSSKVTAALTPVRAQSPCAGRGLCHPGRVPAPPERYEEAAGQGAAAPVLLGHHGRGLSYCGGESAARMGERYVAVDGISNVIRMLEEIEDGRLPEADFFELNACVQGCVGGCLTVENPYGARMRIKKLMKGLPVSRNRFTFKGEDRDVVKFDYELQYVPVFVLDQDRAAAMDKLAKIEALSSSCPGSTAAPAAPPPAGLCRGRGAGPGQRGGLHLQDAGADAVHGRFLRRRRVPARPLPPQEGPAAPRTQEVTPHLFYARKRGCSHDRKRAVRCPVPDGIRPPRPRRAGHRRLRRATCSAGSWAGPLPGTAGSPFMSNQNVAAVALMADVACVILSEGVNPRPGPPVPGKRAGSQPAGSEQGHLCPGRGGKRPAVTAGHPLSGC